MTAKNDADPEDSPLGVLDDAASVDTAGIGILGGTAQVRVTLPAEEDDDLADDGVVDGEVGIDLIVDDLTLPAAPKPVLDAPRLDDVIDAVVVEAPAAEEPVVEEPVVADSVPEEPVPAAEPAADLVAEEEEAAARFLAKAGADRAAVPAAKPARAPQAPVQKETTMPEADDKPVASAPARPAPGPTWPSPRSVWGSWASPPASPQISSPPIGSSTRTAWPSRNPRAGGATCSTHCPGAG